MAVIPDMLDWKQALEVVLDHSDHPVVERYLIAFVGYLGNLEYCDAGRSFYTGRWAWTSTSISSCSV